MGILKAIILFLWAMFTKQAYLAAENLALRQQLADESHLHRILTD